MLWTIPAASAPGREGLELSLHRTMDAEGIHLCLGCGSGSVSLLLCPRDGEFLFSYGRARLERASDQQGRAFVDAVASWLGLELADSDDPEPPPPALTASWVLIGRGHDRFGMEWDTYKLSLRLGERYAEVFLRWSAVHPRAQLVEKWSEYRQNLVAILERVLASERPRRIGTLSAPRSSPDGAMLFGLDRALELEVPVGWLVKQQPEGHWRLSDAAEEMMIEVSYLRLPPLGPDAPTVTERQRAVMQHNEHRDRAAPIATFTRDDLVFAWTEYSFDARDTKCPDAPRRPARERCLVASNEWVQALVTGCWWEADAPVGEQAWNGVIQSLCVAGRIAPAVPSKVQA